jgi:hypothetical protein
MKFTEGKTARLLGLIFTLALLATAFYTGKYYGQVNSDSQATTSYGTYTVDRTSGEVTREPDEITFKRVVGKTIETVNEQADYGLSEGVVLSSSVNPLTLRYFQDLGELERWLGEFELPDIASEVTSETTGQDVTNWDCDDYARKLQKDALQSGYMLSFEVIHADEYNALFKEGQIPDGTIHAINSVIIGNKVYYIEPKTGEIVFVANLD